jgi:hypothetical protein
MPIVLDTSVALDTAPINYYSPKDAGTILSHALARFGTSPLTISCQTLRFFLTNSRFTDILYLSTISISNNKIVTRFVGLNSNVLSYLRVTGF